MVGLLSQSIWFCGFIYERPVNCRFSFPLMIVFTLLSILVFFNKSVLSAGIMFEALAAISAFVPADILAIAFVLNATDFTALFCRLTTSWYFTNTEKGTLPPVP